MMKKFFYYCFYRIASGISFFSALNLFNISLAYADLWVSIGQTFNIFTLACIFCYCLHIKFEFVLVFFPILVTVVVLNSFLLTSDKYFELQKKYKDEKQKKLKGWGVFFYLVFSILIGLVCIWFFKDNISFNTKLI